MSLKSLKYYEFEGDARQWCVEKIDFENVNLLVGKNSTGKSRILSVLNAFCSLISGRHRRPFNSGCFEVEIELDGDLYSCVIEFVNGHVFRELLTVNGEVRLERDKNGDGSLHYSVEDKNIRFQISNESIAIQNKNDQLQHPFIHKLFDWAERSALYNFGSDFGKSHLMALQNYEFMASMGSQIECDVDNVVGVYTSAYTNFGDDFDAAVIRDMRLLGYDLEKVCADHVVGLPNMSAPLVGLFTVERDLNGLRNSQLNMSQGMFRALALVIHLNVADFSNKKRLILIDDIGEGLDYERATKIIDLVIDKAEKNGSQVVMTSNDRFVMNRVPLDYWGILVRKGHRVEAFTPRNSSEIFENFKFFGLSNFDLFKDFSPGDANA